LNWTLTYIEVEERIMRVSDNVNRVTQTARETASWVQNPIARLWQVGRKGFENLYFSLGTHQDNRSHSLDRNGSEGSDRVQLDRDLEQIERTNEIKGKKGVYKLTESIYVPKRSVDLKGSKVNEYGIEEPIIIQYIQIKQIEPDLRNEINEIIELIEKQNDASKYRVLLPRECISSQDDCYLVFENHFNALNQSDLKYKSSLTDSSRKPLQIYNILNNVLQSLEYLHDHCKLFPDRVGIAHGNLEANSLLFDRSEQVYLCNLVLFNFEGNLKELTEERSKKADLKKLGELVDRWLDSQQYEICPRLIQFIENLKKGKFKNAKKALETLKKIEKPENKEIEKPSLENKSPTDREAEDRSRLKRTWLLISIGLFGLLGLVLGFRFAWVYLTSPDVSIQTNPPNNCDRDRNCKIASAFSHIPDQNRNRELIYTSNELWNLIWHSYENIENKLTLEAAFEKQDMRLNLQRAAHPDLAQMWIGTNLEEASKPAAWKNEPIASDGFVVFVSTQEIQDGNGKSLAQLLDGKISLEVIRGIYNGEITNWNQVSGLKNLDRPIKVYLPKEKAVLEILTQVLDLKFDRNLSDIENLDFNVAVDRIVNPTPSEQAEIGIGIGRIGDVFEQCSVYPLAIVKAENLFFFKKEKVIQPLIKKTGDPIDLKTDLCMNKGDYSPDSTLFSSGSYPLSYQWKVAYSDDSDSDDIRAFIQMMNTEEGKNLLREAGLISLPRSQDKTNPQEK
jgi:serine/threonine protein kinase